MEPDVFDSDDVGEVEAFFRQAYSKIRIGAVGENTRVRIARRVLSPGLSLDDADYDFDFDFAAEPTDLLIIADVVANTYRNRSHGAEEVLGPGDQFLINRPGRPYAGAGHASTLRVTLIDPAILAGAAGTGENPVQFLDHRPTSRHAAQRLQRITANLRHELLVADAPLAPLVASSAAQYLAAGVLHAYPNSAITGDTVTDRRDAKPSTVRRAVEFIDGNADIDITVRDIAHAANVTPRALQLAFRRHLGMTPMAHLRDVRLGRAQQDLLEATSGDGRTVTTIAARWGFTGSRFARLYRAAYGEPPSHTLRR